jgi:hypothetical protein
MQAQRDKPQQVARLRFSDTQYITPLEHTEKWVSFQTKASKPLTAMHPVHFMRRRTVSKEGKGKNKKNTE